MAKIKSGGGNKRTVPEGKTQVNFNIENNALEKVRTVAAKERVSNSDIYNLSVDKYLELYEKKNGKIKPSPKGKGLV